MNNLSILELDDYCLRDEYLNNDKAYEFARSLLTVLSHNRLSIEDPKQTMNRKRGDIIRSTMNKSRVSLLPINL